VLEVTLLGQGSKTGRSIADVLEMTISEAVAFFADRREVLAVLKSLADVGLEYLKLGQPVPTLSGGEAQRLKLAGHLAQATTAPSSSRRAGAGSAHPGRGSLFLFGKTTDISTTCPLLGLPAAICAAIRWW
jgi:excinuclease ABC subunit A